MDTKFWERGPATLPKNHLQPEDVAGAILNAYAEGHVGKLDLMPETAQS